MRIVVIDSSTLVGPKEFAAMVSAVARQLTDHVAPAWNRTPPTFEAWPPAPGAAVPGGPGSSTAPPAGAYPIYVFDNADTADALGYHDETPEGQIYGRVFARPVLNSSGGTLLRGANSVSAVLSHEAAELLCDPYCNFWVDGPRKNTWALEVCDPVQGQAYDLDQVAVSNFILPAWFDAYAKTGPYDYMKICKKPFQIARDGYGIVRRGGPGTEKDIFGRWLGKHAEAASKTHPAARSARRKG